MFSADVFCAKHDLPPKNGPVPIQAVNGYPARDNPPRPKPSSARMRRPCYNFMGAFNGLIQVVPGGEFSFDL